MLDVLDLIVRAARTSSRAVVAEIAGAAFALDSRADAAMFFDVAGDELRCAAAFGTRTLGYEGLVLGRERARRLPSLAARAGHHVALRECEAALIPTDRSALAIPMCDGGAPFAVVYLSSRTARAFEPARDLVALVRYAAIPYLLARERELDRNDAMYDGLTGLLAPRAFRTLLCEEVERSACDPTSLPLSLWFVDTDGFKAINDRDGHAQGDRVLQQMASLLRAHAVGGVDVPARNGGDEYCLLLRRSPKSAAIARAHAFVAAVRQHDFGAGRRVTASVGVASIPFDASTASALLECADAAMYHSKRAGRDRVSFAAGEGRFAEFG